MNRPTGPQPSPCVTFAAWLELRGWVKTFTRQARPGAYLRIASLATYQRRSSRDGAPPDYDVTMGMTLRALTTKPELLPHLLVTDALPEHVQDLVRRQSALALG